MKEGSREKYQSGSGGRGGRERRGIGKIPGTYITMMYTIMVAHPGTGTVHQGCM